MKSADPNYEHKAYVDWTTLCGFDSDYLIDMIHLFCSKTDCGAEFISVMKHDSFDTALAAHSAGLGGVYVGCLRETQSGKILYYVNSCDHGDLVTYAEADGEWAVWSGLCVRHITKPIYFEEQESAIFWAVAASIGTPKGGVLEIPLHWS